VRRKTVPTSTIHDFAPADGGNGDAAIVHGASPGAVADPGTGSPEQRLREQEKDGVDAEVLFPGNVGPGFWRGIGHDEAYKAVVRAYNDWLSEEYCSCSPERLIGVGVIPITNIDDAVTELDHCAKIGLKAVAIDNFPAGNRYPTAGDDRFWAAVVDLNMALTIHVEFGFPRRGRGQPHHRAPHQ